MAYQCRDYRAEKSSRHRRSCRISITTENMVQMLITDRIRNKKDQSVPGCGKMYSIPAFFLKKQLFSPRNTSIIMDSIFKYEEIK